MNYQLKQVKRILETNPQTVFEVDPRTFLAKGRVFYDAEKDMKKALRTIDEATKDMELVVSADCNWFDEGTSSSALVFASKKAQDRVWAIIDMKMMKGGYMIQAEFMADLMKYPEDYVLFYNAGI